MADPEKQGSMKEGLKVDVNNDDRSSPSGNNQITLERFNTPTRNVLRKFDDNGDGRIDATEIQAVVSTLVAEKFKSKAFKIGLIILGIFTIVLLGAMFGLTWAVVAALKDTTVEGNTLYPNDGSNTPVMVASTDLTVSKSGALLARNTSSVLSTATYSEQFQLDSSTPFDLLVRMKTFAIKSSSGARIQLDVLGVARIPNSNAPNGYEIKVQTAAGVLVLNGTAWEVEGEVGSLLADLASTPTSTGRRLLQTDSSTWATCTDCQCLEVGVTDSGDETCAKWQTSGGQVYTATQSTAFQANDACSTSNRPTLTNCVDVFYTCGGNPVGRSPTFSTLRTWNSFCADPNCGYGSAAVSFTTSAGATLQASVCGMSGQEVMACCP